MNLQRYTDQQLWISAREAATCERKALGGLLRHLAEIERRRLFAEHKFPSMFEYVTRELGYGESEAIARISAMRVLRDVPEIESKIETGALSLSNLQLAQRLFNKERKSGNRLGRAEKIEVLARLENLTTRAAEKVVAEIRPDMKRAEISFSDIRDDQLREKLLRIKSLLIHSNPAITLPEILHMMCDETLSRLEPEIEESPVAPRVETDTVSAEEVLSQAAIRRHVWNRDQHKCVNCGSKHALQIDHIVPRAAGGASTLENMRLLCRNCNIRAAIKFYGLSKMDKHMPS